MAELSDHVDVDDAYQAIRAHLHERTYIDDPGRVYADLGSLSQLLAAVGELTRNMDAAVMAAVGSDDGADAQRRLDAATALDEVRGLLRHALKAVDEAHVHVGHLIFDGGA